LQTTLGTGFRIVFTFFCVCMCWVLFQPSIAKSMAMFEKLFSIQMGLALPLHNRSLWYTAGFVLVCHLLVSRGVWQWVYARLPAPVLGVGYAVCVCAAMVLAPDSGSGFIYFQF